MRTAAPQILAVFIKNILLLVFSSTIGFCTILIGNLSESTNNDSFIEQEYFSWIGSINMLGVPLGCLLTGVLTNALGRKIPMIFVNILFLVSWILLRFSQNIWQILAALLLTGFGGGLLEAPANIYVSEISQSHLRGILLVTNGIPFALGFLLQFVLGIFFKWRDIATICCILPIISFFCLFWIPESPHWLIVNKKLQHARKNLAVLRGWREIGEVESEFQQIYGECTKHIDPYEKRISKNLKIGLFYKVKLYIHQLSKKSFIVPLYIVSLLFILGNFTGSSTLLLYGTTIFENFRTPIDKYYSTALLGMAQILGFIINIILLRFCGKRKIVLLSLLGLGVSNCVIATIAYTENIKFNIVQDTANQSVSAELMNSSEFSKWLALVFIVCIDLFSACGVDSIPWVFMSEAFSMEIRSTGCCCSAIIGYFIGFLSRKTFFNLISAINLEGTFWLYSVISFVGIILVYYILPETEGKTLEEIANNFSNKDKIKIKYIDKEKLEMNTIL